MICILTIVHPIVTYYSRFSFLMKPFVSGSKGVDREDLPEARMQHHFTHQGSHQVKYYSPILLIIFI